MADEVLRVGLQWENVVSSLDAAIAQAESILKSGLQDATKLQLTIDRQSISQLQRDIKSLASALKDVKLDSSAATSLSTLVNELNQLPKIKNVDSVVKQLNNIKTAALDAAKTVRSFNTLSNSIKSQSNTLNQQGPLKIDVDTKSIDALVASIDSVVDKINAATTKLASDLRSAQRILGTERGGKKLNSNIDVTAAKQQAALEKALADSKAAMAKAAEADARIAAADAKRVASNNKWYQETMKQEQLLGRAGADPSLSENNINKLNTQLNQLTSQINKVGGSQLQSQLVSLQNDFAALQSTISGMDWTNEAEIQKAVSDVAQLQSRIAALRAEAQQTIKVNVDVAKGNYDTTLRSLEASLAQAGSSSVTQGKIAQYGTELDTVRQKLEALKASFDSTGEHSAKAFDAQTKKLQSLSNELDKLQRNTKYDQTNRKGQFFGMSVDDDFVSRVRAAAQSYGTLIDSTEQYSSSARKWSGVVQTQSGDLVKLKAAMDDTGTGFRVLETNMSSSSAAMTKVGVSLKDVAQNYLRYFTGQQFVERMMTQLSQGWEQIKELDTAYTELRKVSDDSTASLQAFRQESFAVADQIASTGLAIQQSAADWVRLGYSIDEASELAKNTSMYANVGDMDIDTATEHMISSVKAFNDEFENDAQASSQIADIFNEIDNKFAISAEGIGSAMERSASSLVAAGNDIYESVAMVTAGNEIMQNPELMGNTLKVVSMRIRGAKTELEDMGEETDGVVESTAKLRDEIKALSGVDIMKDATTFKSTYQILDELADVWDNLTDISQAKCCLVA